MGSYTAVTFSKAQQEQFSVDESGTVKEKAKFEGALRAFKEAKKATAAAAGLGAGGLPPWWILNGVRPNGPDKDMGSYTAVTFSKAQQEQFSVDESGAVKEKAKFESALRVFQAAKQAAEAPQEREQEQRLISV